MSFVPKKGVRLWPCGDRLVTQQELYKIFSSGNLTSIAQVTDTYLSSCQDVRNELGNYKFAPDQTSE